MGDQRRHRADDADAERDPGARPDGPVPEAYVWGNLTSGRASRALWLLLLPFMLVNIAYWMRPGEPGGRPPAAWAPLVADSVYGSAVRLLALCLTALLTLAAAGVGMDLIGWQCAGYGARCAELRPLLGVQLQETELPEKLTVEETIRLFRAQYPRGAEVEELIRQVVLG